MSDCTKCCNHQSSSKIHQPGNDADINIERKLQHLSKTSAKLAAELNDVKLEIRKFMVEISTPLSKERTQEKRKSQHNDSECASEKTANEECSCPEQMSLSGLTTVNDLLKEQICELESKLLEIQKEEQDPCSSKHVEEDQNEQLSNVKEIKEPQQLGLDASEKPTDAESLYSKEKEISEIAAANEQLKREIWDLNSKYIEIRNRPIDIDEDEKSYTVASEKTNNQECTCMEGANNTQNKGQHTSKNLCELLTANEQQYNPNSDVWELAMENQKLKRQICDLQSKYNKLQKGELEDVCKDANLFTTAQKLDKTVVACGTCDECKRLPTDLIDMVKEIKTIADMAYTVGSKKSSDVIGPPEAECVCKPSTHRM